jgi:hypothetical protein
MKIAAVAAGRTGLQVADQALARGDHVIALATPRPCPPVGPAVRQRRAAGQGLRLAQAARGVGAAYAAVSVYWALGGTWLLDTLGGTLEQQGRAGNPGIILAVWAAAVLKVIGAIVPLAAVGVTPGQATIARRRLMRVLA